MLLSVRHNDKTRLLAYDIHNIFIILLTIELWPVLLRVHRLHYS